MIMRMKSMAVSSNTNILIKNLEPVGCQFWAGTTMAYASKILIKVLLADCIEFWHVVAIQVVKRTMQATDADLLNKTI